MPDSKKGRYWAKWDVWDVGGSVGSCTVTSFRVRTMREAWAMISWADCHGRNNPRVYRDGVRIKRNGHVWKTLGG